MNIADIVSNNPNLRADHLTASPSDEHLDAGDPQLLSKGLLGEGAQPRYLVPRNKTLIKAYPFRDMIWGMTAPLNRYLLQRPAGIILMTILNR